MSELPLALVVDDDPGLLMFVEDILAVNGFAVLVASSADEALGILQNQANIALLVTDVLMPGTLDGLGLVSQVRRRWPRLQVVVASGRMPAEAAANAPQTAFLEKPFNESELLAAVAEAQSSHV